MLEQSHNNGWNRRTEDLMYAWSAEARAHRHVHEHMGATLRTINNAMKVMRPLMTTTIASFGLTQISSKSKSATLETPLWQIVVTTVLGACITTMDAWSQTFDLEVRISRHLNSARLLGDIVDLIESTMVTSRAERTPAAEFKEMVVTMRNEFSHTKPPVWKRYENRYDALTADDMAELHARSNDSDVSSNPHQSPRSPSGTNKKAGTLTHQTQRVVNTQLPIMRFNNETDEELTDVEMGTTNSEL